MSTSQPSTPVETVASDSKNPFTALPSEEPARPASASSESSSRSTGSNEIVVVNSAKEEEEEGKGEHVGKVAEEEEKPIDTPHVGESASEEAPPVVSEEKGNDSLTTIVPAPEVIPIPDKPAATQAAKAAGHATEKITSRIPCFLAKTNAFVTRFNKLMSTTSGTDRFLMTTSYSLTALTAQLDRISRYRELAHSASEAKKVSVIPLGFFGYLLLARRQESSRLAAISTRLKALASLIADVRIFMRLLGMFGMYEWLVDTLRNPPKDMTLRKITYLQIAVNILYQLLENLAYLGQHKILPIGKKRQNSYWLWSSRFWMAHVVLEFWRLKRDRDLSLRGKGKAKWDDSEKEPRWYEVADVMKSDGKKSVWLRQLWSNIAYAPLTVHWSLERGALTPLGVGTLGAIAGGIGLHQAWSRTV